MANHLTVAIDGDSTPVTAQRRRRWWPRLNRRAVGTSIAPVVAMDDPTRQWLADLQLLDAMLGLVDDLGDDGMRAALAHSLHAAAKQAVPAGVAVGLVATNGDEP